MIQFFRWLTVTEPWLTVVCPVGNDSEELLNSSKIILLCLYNKIIEHLRSKVNGQKIIGAINNVI